MDIALIFGAFFLASCPNYCIDPKFEWLVVDSKVRKLQEGLSE